MSTVREKITQAVESWFLMEPLFFAVWTSHQIEESAKVDTIRVQRGRIEYNPQFLNRLNRSTLSEVLLFEAMRIVLRHPYQRRQEDARLTYQASNLTVQELLQTRLPMPKAADIFGTKEFDRQYLEFYYQKLQQQSATSLEMQAEGQGSGEQGGVPGKSDSGPPDDQGRQGPRVDHRTARVAPHRSRTTQTRQRAESKTQRVGTKTTWPKPTFSRSSNGFGKAIIGARSAGGLANRSSPRFDRASIIETCCGCFEPAFCRAAAA